VRHTFLVLAILVLAILVLAIPAGAAKRIPGGVYARHALGIDAETGEVLFAKNDRYVVPIASITKLMTALVVRDRGADMDSVVTVTRKLRRGAGRTRLKVGEQIRMENLLHLALMVSDNFGARELAAHAGLEREDFVAAMNARADSLGMDETAFVDVTGLSDDNVSTVHDVATLLKTVTGDSLLADVMQKKRYEFNSVSGRNHVLGNTNRMVYDGRWPVRSGKTGHIGNSGYCIATWVEQGEREVIAVVLGSVNDPTRFNDVRRILRRVAARDRRLQREAGG